MICFKMYIHILSHKITSQKLSKNSHKNNWDNNSVFISYTAANSFFIKMTSNNKNLLLGLYLILYVSYSEVCFSYQSRGLKIEKVMNMFRQRAIEISLKTQKWDIILHYFQDGWNFRQKLSTVLYSRERSFAQTMSYW